MTNAGARKISAVDPSHLRNLNSGQAEAKTLSEALAIDHRALLSASVPHAPNALVHEVTEAQTLGILKRMTAIGAALLRSLSPDDLATLALHPSDTVRGWWCFATAADSTRNTQQLLTLAQPLADDPRFTVREWVWMALRPRLTADLAESIALLTPWTDQGSANVRRFASEALRPRGVWASHIATLKEHPNLGEPILEPLRSDTSRYVQDSVANWINDAAKSQPDWARTLCTRWDSESPTVETARITARALRSLRP